MGIGYYKRSTLRLPRRFPAARNDTPLKRQTIIYRTGLLRAAPWLPRYEGAGKLPILGNLTEGVS